MCLMHPLNCEYLCEYGLKITISTSPAIIQTQWWNRLILWLCWKFPLDVLIFFHITFYPTMMKSTHLFPCDRWCLFHVSERKMQPGDSGLVTPCWITGKAPPVLLWTTPKSRATAYHLRRNRPAQYTLGETHANVEKKGHLSTAVRHVLHFPWQVLVEGSGRHRCYAELTFPHKTPTVMHENVFFSKSAHADT